MEEKITKKIFFNGLLVIMLMFGMMVFGDGFDIPDPAFNGTWVANNSPIMIVLNNGIYEYSLIESFFDYHVSGYFSKGTYTTNSKNIIFQATHYKGFSNITGDLKFTLWYEKSKIVPDFRDAINEIGADMNISVDFIESVQQLTVEVDGNTLTNNFGTAFIKKINI
jgi:hypothetical protein